MNKNGAVLIVTGGKLQEPAVRAARSLDMDVIVTDRDPGCACAQMADQFFPVDIYDVARHKSLVRDLLGQGVRLRAVFTAAADPILTVANAARAAALPGAPIKAAVTCASKSVTRWALKAGEVPQPRYYDCDTPESMREAINILGLPVIVKATGSAGGKGHTKVRKIEDATDAVFDLAMSYSKDFVLVEELLEGAEISAEALWWNGVMTPLNAVDRPFAHRAADTLRYAGTAIHGWGDGIASSDSWRRAIAKGDDVAIELGHYNPALMPAKTWDEVWDVVHRCGRAIGLGDARGGHIHKCDLILTDDGVKVIETTLRLSGNWDSGMTSPLAHGVDYTLGALKLAMGDIPDWTLFAPRWHRHAVCLFYFSPPGKVEVISKPLTDDARVIQRYFIGDTVPALDSYSTLAAWVIADGETREIALTKAYRGLCEVDYLTDGAE